MKMLPSFIPPALIAFFFAIVVLVYLQGIEGHGGIVGAAIAATNVFQTLIGALVIASAIYWRAP